MLPIYRMKELEHETIPVLILVQELASFFPLCKFE